MKEIRAGGITYLQSLRYGTGEWYYLLDHPNGDLYEAEEIHNMGGIVKSSRLLLVHYPDGEVHEPIHRKDCVVFGDPVWLGGEIGILAVDFFTETVRVHAYDPAARETRELVSMPLSETGNCYNLMIHAEPLMLTRQPNDGTFELLWPVKSVFPVSPRETFFATRGEEMYFADWYEDPEYHEKTVVRHYPDGGKIREMNGSVEILPDGQWWHLI